MNLETAKQLADAAWRNGDLCRECPHRRVQQVIGARATVRLETHCGVRDDHNCPAVEAWERGRR